MSATLQVVELPHGLSIRVSERRRLGNTLLVLAIGGGGAYILFRVTASSRITGALFGALFAISLSREIVSSLRGTEVELRCGNLDFTSSGHAPGGYSPCTISRAEIDRLEFRKSSGGGDTPDRPQGLYIEYRGGLWNSASCALPHIDEAQTEQAIEAIYRRFPDTGTLAPADSAEPYLTTLNLSQKKTK